MTQRRCSLGIWLVLFFAGSICPALPSTAETGLPFVRVSPRDSRYLELTDGRPYVPIGLNLIAPSVGARGADASAGLQQMQQWMERLAQNRGNYIRVWLSSPFWDVEHEKSGVYDEDKAKRIDALLALARQHGIRMKFTIEHFRSIEGKPRQRWAFKPLHHVSQGGTATNLTDFFGGQASRDRFKQKLAWYAHRYGDNPTIYGWELWNEINAVGGGDYLAWTEYMLPELHRLFPQNLAMQSLGSFDHDRVRPSYQRLSRMPGNDVAQVHRYLDLGASLAVCHGPVDILAANAVRELLATQPNRPVILAESGAVEPSHSGPFKLYAKDPEGTLLHDILFAPFFAGAAGPGQCWHWDEYVDRNHLWYHFGRFATAIKEVDPPAEAFQPVQLPHSRLRLYALNGKRTILVWGRDSQATWQTELAEGKTPEILSGLRVDLRPVLAQRRAPRASAYNPWNNQTRPLRVESGSVVLPDFARSLVLRVEFE